MLFCIDKRAAEGVEKQNLIYYTKKIVNRIKYFLKVTEEIILLCY